jgi:hypothetical protein
LAVSVTREKVNRGIYVPKGRWAVKGRIALLLAAMVTAILSLGATFFAAETTVAAETTTYLTSIADANILENAPPPTTAAPPP